MSHTIDPSQAPNSANQRLEDTSVSQSAALPIIEEQIQVGKQLVEKGVVRVSKKVHEEDVTVNVPLIHEEHDIDRVAINQIVDTPPSVRYEGETMIIPVLREEVIVQKRLVLVEELRITKKLVQTQSEQHVTLRKEEVIVDRTDTGSVNPAAL